MLALWFLAAALGNEPVAYRFEVANHSQVGGGDSFAVAFVLDCAPTSERLDCRFRNPQVVEMVVREGADSTRRRHYDVEHVSIAIRFDDRGRIRGLDVAGYEGDDKHHQELEWWVRSAVGALEVVTPKHGLPDSGSWCVKGTPMIAPLAGMVGTGAYKTCHTIQSHDGGQTVISTTLDGMIVADWAQGSVGGPDRIHLTGSGVTKVDADGLVVERTYQQTPDHVQLMYTRGPAGKLVKVARVPSK